MKSLTNFYYYTDDGSLLEYDAVKQSYMKKADKLTHPKLLNGLKVGSYKELLLKVAELNYSNQDLTLVFRGQSQDFKTNIGYKSSGLYPTIFRNPPARCSVGAPKVVDFKFKLLNDASSGLRDIASKLPQRVQRNVRNIEVLRWALIQHYEITDTPYLDLTPKIDVALNFALQEAKDYCYLYVIGLPNQNSIYQGSVTDSIESVYLPRYCPPEFIRPHIQNGFVVGEFPPVKNYQDRREAGDTRAPYNFHNRMVCKFKIPVSFNKEGMANLTSDFLLSSDDAFLEIAEEIKLSLAPNKKSLERVLNGEAKALNYQSIPQI